MIIRLAFMFIILSSCALTLPQRKLASDQNPIRDRTELNSCVRKLRSYCYRTYPYEDLKRKFSEIFEYQYLNRRNIIQSQYLRCSTNALINCSREHGFEGEAQVWESRLQNLQIEKMIESSQKNTFFYEEKKFWSQTKLAKKIKISSVQMKEYWSQFYFLRDAYEKIKEIAKVSTHGIGVGLSPKATAGLGYQVEYEAIIHNGKLALFCAPGFNLETDIGVSAQASIIKTFGCETNDEYSGKFFTTSASLSGELIGLPFSVGGNYSMSVDLKNFLKELAHKKENNEFNPKNFMVEMEALSKKSASELIDLFNDKKDTVAALLTMKYFIELYGEEAEHISGEFSRKIEDVENLTNDSSSSKNKDVNFPLSNFLKNIIKNIHEKLNGQLEFAHTEQLLSSLEKNLGGCDAASGGVGVSFSLSPVSLGTSIYHYKKIAEIDIKSLLYLTAMSKEAQEDNDIDDEEIKKLNHVLNNSLQNLPSKEKELGCSQEFADSVYEDFQNLKAIFN